MKERIKLENKFECKIENCDRKVCGSKCKEFGVCVNCKHYNMGTIDMYNTNCRCKCIYFNEHKQFTYDHLSNVEFIANPEVRDYICRKYKKGGNI